MLRYEGSRDFRVRLAVATLSGKSIRIDNIRTEPMNLSENTSTTKADSSSTPQIGLQDFEANYLRLLDEISDGNCSI